MTERPRQLSRAGPGSALSRAGPGIALVRGLAAVGASVIATAAGPAMAQSVDVFRGLVHEQQIGQAFQALSIFSGTPGIGAANYDASGFRISTYQLPAAHEFAPFDGGVLGQVAVHTELTVSYLQARGSDLFTVAIGSLPPPSSRTDFQVFTGLAGAGLDFLVSDNVTIRPIVLAGYSRIESDTGFSGPAAPQVDALTGGILHRVRIDDALVGGALEAIYQHTFTGDYRLTGNLRYNEFLSSPFNTSDQAFRGDGYFGVATTRIGVSGPTSLQVLGRDLRWLGFAGGTVLTGRQRSDLGFNAFAEIGGGVEVVDRQVIQGIEGIILRGSVIFGNGLNGWSAGLSLAF